MGSFFSFLTAAYYIPRIVYAASPAIILPEKSRKVQQGGGISPVADLRRFVETRCPSLFKPFHPAWWLKSGHLQTMYCVLGDFSKIDKVEYDRKLLRTVDGGTLGLDFTPPTEERILPDDTPVVVVLHGLTGGSHESYVRAILAPACTPVEQGGLGYRGIVVNFRGCAGVPVTSQQLYSAGHTEDIRMALMYISKLYPNAPLLGVGFSLGANVLTRYLAQEGERSRLMAGVAVGCPWDLRANSDKLESSWLHREVYSRGMGQNLTILIKRHLASLEDHPHGDMPNLVSKLDQAGRPTILQFDEAITRLVGGSSPPFPLETAYAYYHWASSHKVLPDIRVPFLAISDADDPVVRAIPIDLPDTKLSPWVAFAVTRGGGHLGWFEQGPGLFSLSRWMSRPIIEWLRASGEELPRDFSKRKPLKEVDGFLTEEGREDIGCKEIEGGGHVVGVEGEEGLLAGL